MGLWSRLFRCKPLEVIPQIKPVAKLDGPKPGPRRRDTASVGLLGYWLDYAPNKHLADMEADFWRPSIKNAKDGDIVRVGHETMRTTRAFTPEDD